MLNHIQCADRDPAATSFTFDEVLNSSLLIINESTTGVMFCTITETEERLWRY